MSEKNPTLVAPSFLFDEKGNYSFYVSPEVPENHDRETWHKRFAKLNLDEVADKEKEEQAKLTDPKISSLTDDKLQSAFEDIQYAELKLLKKLEELNTKKEHLLYEARRRNIVLLWIDQIKGRAFGEVFRAERAIRKVYEFVTQKEHWRKNQQAFLEESRKKQKSATSND